METRVLPRPRSPGPLLPLVSGGRRRCRVDQALGRALLRPARPLGACSPLPSAHTLVPSLLGVSRAWEDPRLLPSLVPLLAPSECIFLFPARPPGSVGTTRIALPLPTPSSPLRAAPGSRRGHGAQASSPQMWSRVWAAFLLETPACPHLHHMVLLLSSAPPLASLGGPPATPISPWCPQGGQGACLPPVMP